MNQSAKFIGLMKPAMRFPFWSTGANRSPVAQASTTKPRINPGSRALPLELLACRAPPSAHTVTIGRPVALRSVIGDRETIQDSKADPNRRGRDEQAARSLETARAAAKVITKKREALHAARYGRCNLAMERQSRTAKLIQVDRVEGKQVAWVPETTEWLRRKSPTT